MGVAAGAPDLGPIAVGQAVDSLFDLIVETGPATAGRKLVLRKVEWRVASLAAKNASVVEIVVNAAAGRLGSALRDDVLFILLQFMMSEHILNYNHMRKIILILSIALIIAIALSLHFRAREKKPPDFLVLYGNVDVREVDLGFRVEGRVVDMPFQEGDFVSKGVLMGTLERKPYVDQVTEAQANIESTSASLNNAQLVFNRRAALLPEGAVSQEDYDNARTNCETYAANLMQMEAALKVALKNYEDTQLFCPNDGTILTRIREPGTVVEPSVPIYTLSLLDPVWIRAFVSETDLGNIYFGMPAEVHTDAGKAYKGHIGFISPVAEFTPKTVETTQLRTDLVYRLRIIADNPDCYLKQGMPVTVKLWKHGPAHKR